MLEVLAVGVNVVVVVVGNVGRGGGESLLELDELRLELGPGVAEGLGVGALPDGVLKGGVGQLLNVVGPLDVVLEGLVQGLEGLKVCLNHTEVPPHWLVH